MELQASMTQLVELQNKIRSMVDDLVKQLCEKVTSTPRPGVEIKSDSPKVAIVKFSALQNNWSPDYHIPSCQAEAIRRKLENCHTPTSAVSAVRIMIDTGKVKIGENAVYLNETTMDIIKNSELGKYAMTHNNNKEEL